MADTKISGLTEDTAPLAADLLATVDDPSGTPLSKKSLISNVVGYVVTTAGDIIYATGSRLLARLAIGTDGQTLRVNSGATAPEWSNDLKNVGILGFGAAVEVTVAAGEITVTQTHHAIDTQDDDATDDLNTINGGSDGDLLLLKSANSGRDVTLKNGVDNILINTDATLTSAAQSIILIKSGANWIRFGSI